MAEATVPRRARTAFPTAEETLALQASLLDQDAAIEAWRKLSKIFGPEEAGIAWIAPLLMHNLARLLPEDPWVKEHPHFLTLSHLKARATTESAQATLRFLEDAGIPTLALKGLALGATVYPSPGLRTVSDLDILVPRKDLFRALDAFKARGLRSGSGEPRTEGDLRANHAHAFYPPKRHELTIDLHWHVLSSARGDDDDTSFWSGAVPLKVGSASTRMLCAEDQLLHALVHGVRWTRMPHVRWVADAVMILRKAGDSFDAERFLEASLRFDVVAPVQEGLRFVADVVGEGRALCDRVLTLKRSRFAGRAFKARSTAYENRTAADRIALRMESALWAFRARRVPPSPGTNRPR
jgi:hypothetical protein